MQKVWILNFLTVKYRCSIYTSRDKERLGIKQNPQEIFFEKLLPKNAIKRKKMVHPPLYILLRIHGPNSLNLPKTSNAPTSGFSINVRVSKTTFSDFCVIFLKWEAFLYGIIKKLGLKYITSFLDKCQLDGLKRNIYFIFLPLNKVSNSLQYLNLTFWATFSFLCVNAIAKKSEREKEMTQVQQSKIQQFKIQ